MEENGIPLSKAIPKLVSDQTNAILGANSFQEIYHALEEEGDKGEPKPKEAKKNLEDAHWASWIEDWALLKLERIDHSLAG